VGLQVQDFSLSLSGVQLLVDGTVVYSSIQSPTLVMTSGFAGKPLSVGDHIMTVRITGQVGTSVSYVVSGFVDMSRGLPAADYRSHQWPERTMVLRVGEVVEFPFKVPL
jgi:hypothetical protein